MLSTHHTSEGWVRYRRCICGTVSIELVTLAEAADRAPTHRTGVREQVPAG
ncbi:MAG: hypothetical protein L0H84_16450 [Pseudonocardia sp.]|nr:hypothetical protein [Pseudonocardia sp.]